MKIRVAPFFQRHPRRIETHLMPKNGHSATEKPNRLGGEVKPLSEGQQPEGLGPAFDHLEARFL